MNAYKMKTELFFGFRAVEHLSEMPYRNLLIITDGFLESSGALAKLVQHLPAGARYETYSNVRPDPSQELVDEGAAVLTRVRPDLLVAFGGGSCIDAAKAMLLSACEGGMERPYFLAVPTTAGTGSEVTNFAVVTRGSDKVVLIDDFLAPDGALLEADFTRTVPPAVTADTGMDVLTHALEAYVSSTATSFTDAMAVKALRIVCTDLPAAFRDGMAMRSRTRMIEASCIAGIAFTNAGLGINHSLAHALGGRFHVAHGRLNAVLLPYVIRFHLGRSDCREAYERLAVELGMVDADELLTRICALRAELGIENSLSELGRIDATRFEAELSAIAEAAQHDRCTPTNPCAVSKQDLVNILRDAFAGR